MGASDCGLFAIANAFTLCNGENPVAITYAQGVMRKMLSLSFYFGEIIQFVFTKHTFDLDYHTSDDVDIFCHCRQPYVYDSLCLKCSWCELFHSSCEKESISEKFICSNCLRE